MGRDMTDAQRRVAERILAQPGEMLAGAEAAAAIGMVGRGWARPADKVRRVWCLGRFVLTGGGQHALRRARSRIAACNGAP